MPSLYLTKELTSSPPLPLPASLLSKKLSLPKSTQRAVDSSARRTTVTRIKSSNTTKSLHCFHHYNKQLHPLPLLHREQSRPYFNLHLIDYIDNTVSFTKEFLQPAKQHSIIYPNWSNIYPPTTSDITDIQNDNDIINLQWLTKRGLGPIVPTSWFSTKYKWHFSDLSTYRCIDNFNCKQPSQTPTHHLANSKNGPYPTRQTTTALHETTTQTT